MNIVVGAFKITVLQFIPRIFAPNETLRQLSCSFNVNGTIKDDELISIYITED
jgi:hypothetical protein